MPTGVNLSLQKDKGLDMTQECWTLRTERGWSTRRIATYLTEQGHPITQPGVVRALRRGRELVMANIADVVGADRASSLRRFEHIYEEARDAWEKSKQARTRKTSRQVDGAKGSTKLAQINSEEQHGDPRYLAQMNKAEEMICRIMGHFAPLKVQAVDPDRPHETEAGTEVDRQLSKWLKFAGVTNLKQLEASAIDVTPTEVK